MRNKLDQDHVAVPVDTAYRTPVSLPNANAIAATPHRKNRGVARKGRGRKYA
jgi:hypothetical protein